MGIHFACHHCNHSLHVKDFQAGKRGRCPECKGSFRVPKEDAAYSLELIESLGPVADEGMDQRALSLVLDKVSNKSKGGIALDAKSQLANNESLPVSSLALSKVDESLPNRMEPLPTVLAEAVDAAWFVRPPSGGQFGPASSKLLMEWIAEKRVTQDSYVWREGMAQWQQAIGLLPELFGQPTPPAMDSVGLAAPATVASGLVKKKREQKRRQQWTAIILLGALSLILLSILIFVLLFPASKTP